MIALLCKASITWLKRSEGSLSYWAGLHFFNARCVRTLRSPTSSTTRGDGYERIAKGCMHKSGTLSGLVDHVWYHPGQSRTAREARWWWWWWLTFKRSSLKLGSDGWGWMRDWWSMRVCSNLQGSRTGSERTGELSRSLPSFIALDAAYVIYAVVRGDDKEPSWEGQVTQCFLHLRLESPHHTKY